MNSLKIIQSDFSAKETGRRLVAKIVEVGWHVFVCIDHAKQARGTGLYLPPTEVYLFGSPKIGTLLMQSNPTSAIDLPVKALVWEDDEDCVLVAYNTTEWLKERHHITDDTLVNQIGEIVETVCQFAAKG